MVNQAVTGKGGFYRYLDFVSFLPEFLQHEDDVVLLFQLFSDYLNNAYRNVTTATKFRILKKVPLSYFGVAKEEISKLYALFSRSIAKNASIIYLSLPEHPARDVIEYAGTIADLNTSIISWPTTNGERYYIYFINYPAYSGIYLVEGTALHADPLGTSQDPFNHTKNIPIESPVGLVPRALKMTVSDIGQIYERTSESYNDVIFAEVFFDITLDQIESIASVNEVVEPGTITDINPEGNQYLVDWYNFLGGFQPSMYSGTSPMTLTTADSLNIFSNASGIFYFKELASLEVPDGMANTEGKNTWADPTDIFSTTLRYSDTVNGSTRKLILPYQYSEDMSKHPVPGDYLVRVVDNAVDPISIDISTYDSVTNSFSVASYEWLHIGDQVKIFVTGSSSTIQNNITYTIVNIDYVNSRVIFDNAVGSASVATALVYSISKSNCDVSIVDSIDLLSNKIVLKSFTGDFVSSGEFAVVRYGKIWCRYIINRNVNIWSNVIGTKYLKETLVSHNGIAYEVRNSVTIIAGSISPNLDSVNYRSIMSDSVFSITSSDIRINPYISGPIPVTGITYGSAVDLQISDMDYYYSRLFIESLEDLGFKFTNEQRDFIFNMEYARQIDLDRNGWVEIDRVFTQTNHDHDITNALAIPFQFTVTQVTISGYYITLKLDRSHSQEVGGSVEFSGASAAIINATYQIVQVPTPDTIVIKISDNSGISLSSGFSARFISVPNGTVLYSRYNMFQIDYVNQDVPVVDDQYYVEAASASVFSDAIDSVTGTRHIVLHVTCELNRPTFIKSSGAVRVLGFSSPYFNGDCKVVSVNGIEVVYAATVTYPVGETFTVPAISGSPYMNPIGWYRYVINEIDWQRRASTGNPRIIIKSRKVTVNAGDEDALAESGVPCVYSIYTDADITTEISHSNYVFTADIWSNGGAYFNFRTVKNLDTSVPYEQIFDSRHDTNSVVSTTQNISGIPDMKYPLAEKIERLMYQKDPDVIDIEFITYLGRFMGYDLTTIIEDITEAPQYNTDEQRESAIRTWVQSLPQFNALKSTEPGLNMILLAFGIVGEFVSLWTERSNPYVDFIPDTDVQAYRMARLKEKKNSHLIPTPHFKVNIQVDGVYSNVLTPEVLDRLANTITTYKPINTVFRGIVSYINFVLNARISIGQNRTKGRMQFDVGYDLFSNEDSVNCPF